MAYSVNFLREYELKNHYFDDTNSKVNRMAEQFPDRVAIEIDEEKITYAELIKKVNRLANFIVGCRVPLQASVIIYMDRSIECIVAMLAVSKAGCVFVPIDPVHSESRIRHILTDATHALILVDSEISLSIFTQSDAVVILPNVADKIAEYPCSPPRIAIRPDFGMYILYTSGTTGKPKGVLIHHKGVENNLDSIRKHWPLHGRVLQFASLGFDASIPEWAGTLTMGGTIVMIRNRALTLGNQLIDFVDKSQIAFMKMPSAVLSTLSNQKDLVHLKTLVTAGDACTQNLVESWASNGRKFFNCYDPTETTIGATMALCEPGAERVSLGKPHPGVTIYILDRALNPVGIQEIGEIYIGGYGVSYGYINDRKLTAEKFLPDPFAKGGARMYKSGDLARLRFDGSLEFCGRVDSQVKIRGYRVELEEVTAALRSIEMFEGATSIVICDNNERPDKIIGFFSVKGNCRADIEGVRSRLRELLPEYMLPHELIQMEAFRLTANGKIDRSFLEEYYKIQSQTSETKQHSAYSALAGLVGIWSKVLRGREIEQYSDFFELGGTSLDAAALIAEIEEEYGAAPSIADLYERPMFADFEVITRKFIEAFSC